MAEIGEWTSDGKGLDKTCKCIFCGGEFQAKEIQFCINRKGVQNPDWYDQVYEEHLAIFKDCDLEVPYRQWLDWADDPKNVLVWEENGSIPKVVSGTLRDDDEENNTSGFGFGAGLGFGNFAAHQSEKEDEGDKEKEKFESSIRVCPKCHMTLPEGFMSYPIVRVGLLGGPRSGKTTYMTVATQYMLNRFGDLDNGLELGDVQIVPECEEYIEKLYRVSNEETVGLSPTTINDDGPKDPPILPIVLLVTPYESGEPFYLIMQDIPGEYFKAENRDMLSNSGIRNSTDLIMLVDVNHFVKTRQQSSEEYGEYCRMELSRLFGNLRYLGERMDRDKLNSIQICITKIDFWAEADRKIASSGIGMPADDLHRGKISEDRMDKVSRTIRAALSSIPNHDYSKLIDNMQKQLGLKDGTGFKKAYSAVSSRNMQNVETEMGDEFDYSRSINVVEPILRILGWHGLLPVKTRW